MEVLNLIRLFAGWVFPYISRIHIAYVGEDSSHFRYRTKCLVIKRWKFSLLTIVTSSRCNMSGAWGWILLELPTRKSVHF